MTKTLIWKLLLLSVLIVALTPLIVTAQDRVICQDNIKLNEPCRMVTPVISSCSNFTYDIMDVNGALIINQSNLTQLNGEIYFFDFNLVSTGGTFVIRLCDDTTREIFVSQDNIDFNFIFFILIATALIFLVIGLYFELALMGVVSGTLFLIIAGLIWINGLPFLNVALNNGLGVVAALFGIFIILKIALEGD